MAKKAESWATMCFVIYDVYIIDIVWSYGFVLQFLLKCCRFFLRQSYVISEGYLFDVSVSCLHICKYLYVDTASLLVLFLLLCLRFVTVLLLSCLLACLFVCLFACLLVICSYFGSSFVFWLLLLLFLLWTPGRWPLKVPRFFPAFFP